MKRNTLSTGYANNNNHKNNNNNNQIMVMKDFLENNGEDDHHHYMNGFPWPPRSYTCSFCRKEFKSAQALGGHMNVHRRDRARLRQSSPTSSPTPTTDHHNHGHAQGHAMLNLNLNPNLISSSTSSNSFSFLQPSWSSSHHFSTDKPHVTSTLPLLVSPTTTTTTTAAAPSSSSYSSPFSASPSELKRWVVVDGILLKNPLTTKTSEATKSKIGEDGCKILRMDLEIGLPREYDLDLELRLGNCS